MTVKQKQCLLCYLGYYNGKIDGIWGALSAAATAAFQKDNELEADGIFGSLTEETILRVVATGGAPEDDDGGDDEKIAVTWWDSIEFFKRDEFKCKCGGIYCKGFPAEPNEKLVRTADRVRKHFNAVATVSSGVRCEQHNLNVGGTLGSRHKLGKAMDFCVKGVTSAQLMAYVKQQPEIRYAYAIDADFVHMDVL